MVALNKPFLTLTPSQRGELGRMNILLPMLVGSSNPSKPKGKMFRNAYHKWYLTSPLYLILRLFTNTPALSHNATIAPDYIASASYLSAFCHMYAPGIWMNNYDRIRKNTKPCFLIQYLSESHSYFIWILIYLFARNIHVDAYILKMKLRDTIKKHEQCSSKVRNTDVNDLINKCVAHDPINLTYTIEENDTYKRLKTVMKLPIVDLMIRAAI